MSGNYQPIALTSTFSKFFEKIFITRIFYLLDRFKTFSDDQFGFVIKGKSATDMLCLIF